MSEDNEKDVLNDLYEQLNRVGAALQNGLNNDELDKQDVAQIVGAALSIVGIMSSAIVAASYAIQRTALQDEAAFKAAVENEVAARLEPAVKEEIVNRSKRSFFGQQKDG